jgi:ribosomal protein S27E
MWGPLTDEQTPEMLLLHKLAEDAVNENARVWAARRATVQTTHPGFTITCEECGSDQVYVSNSVSWSSCSGIGGEVALVCSDCGERTAIFEPDNA